jgi:plasmid replication initiation protein
MNKTAIGKTKTAKHPKLYSIFKPNELIHAKKQNMNLMELRVYNEVLNNNHIEEPDRLVYKVPYHYVFDVRDAQNKMHNVRRISRNLQQRIFYFNKTFMMEHFGENADASMVPFPKILYHDDCFEVELYRDFKKILTLIKDGGFTKGDIETLRVFNHEISNSLYWLIRQRQVWQGTWEVDLEELKELLGLAGKYEVYSNFKSKVLDITHHEFKDTWVEFEYTPIRRGQGAPVKAILFKFRNGPKQEKDVPAGEDYLWEEKLLHYQVAAEKVKEIRHRVRVNQISEIGFTWDYEYVKFSIEAMIVDLRDIKKDTHKKQVVNVGGWIYSGLMKGQWLEYVNKRKEKILKESQQTIDWTTSEVVGAENTKFETESISDKTKKALNSLSNTSKEVLDQDGLGEYQKLYDDTDQMGGKKTFDEFMALNRFNLEGNSWVRYE